MEASADPPLLARGVHCCFTQDHLVFLDLRKDSYSAVPAAAAPSFGAECGARIRATLLQNAEALAEAGLIASADGGGRPPTKLVRAHPTAHLLGPEHDRRLFGQVGAHRASARSAWLAASACRQAGLLLRKRPISGIVAAVAARKRAADVTPCSHVRAFAAFRPWWPRRYLCLFDSLALALYLARCGVAADWVFGVQLQPWGAHCWIECDGLLANEGAEYAARFTPIMVV